MRTSALVWIVVVVLLALGAWWFFTMPPVATQNNTDINVSGTIPAGSQTPVGPADEPLGSTTGSGASAPMSATITYGPNGFSPQEVTIKKGGTVTWTNQSGAGMWVASAQHPTHTTYSGTALSAHCPDTNNDSFDQCQNGSAYSFTFEKVGTWGYHNHSNASRFGRVIVVE